MTFNKTDFATHLKNLRLRKNISMQKLADLLGLSTQSIFNYEKGTNLPDLSILGEYAKALDVNVENLIRYDLNVNNESYSFDINKFKTNLKKLRINNHYTLTNLSEKLDCSAQNISKWENGTGLPSISNLIKLSEIYNVSFSSIYYGYEYVITPVEEPKSEEDKIEKSTQKPLRNRHAFGRVITLAGLSAVVATTVIIGLNNNNNIETRPKDDPVVTVIPKTENIDTEPKEDVPPEYEFLRFERNEDCSNAYAVYVNKADSEDLIRYEANVSSNIIKEPTCAECGTAIYTITYDTYSVEIELNNVPKLNHDYENVFVNDSGQLMCYCNNCLKESPISYKSLGLTFSIANREIEGWEIFYQKAYKHGDYDYCLYTLYRQYMYGKYYYKFIETSFMFRNNSITPIITSRELNDCFLMYESKIIYTDSYLSDGNGLITFIFYCEDEVGPAMVTYSGQVWVGSTYYGNACIFVGSNEYVYYLTNGSSIIRKYENYEEVVFCDDNGINTHVSCISYGDYHVVAFNDEIRFYNKYTLSLVKSIQYQDLGELDGEYCMPRLFTDGTLYLLSATDKLTMYVFNSDLELTETHVIINSFGDYNLSNPTKFCFAYDGGFIVKLSLESGDEEHNYMISIDENYVIDCYLFTDDWSEFDYMPFYDQNTLFFTKTDYFLINLN